MEGDLVPGQGRRNYTGLLTKTIVYTGSLVFFLAAFGLTIASIAVPKWVSYYSKSEFHLDYGLHRRCSSLTGGCEPFPRYDDCVDDGRYFCSMWRTIGFLMSAAVVFEGMTIVAYIIILNGSKRTRETGGGILGFLLMLNAILQCISMALVAFLFDNDERFFVGWKLSDSWIMCTVSWGVSFICAIVVVVAARVLPSEGGYELIPDQEEWH